MRSPPHSFAIATLCGATHCLLPFAGKPSPILSSGVCVSALKIGKAKDEQRMSFAYPAKGLRHVCKILDRGVCICV